MVINHLEKLFVTSDAATIIRELEVVHPAGKVLVMASQQQEHEVSFLRFIRELREGPAAALDCRRRCSAGRVFSRWAAGLHATGLQ